MRVLFFTDNFPPEVNAPARRTYEHCLEWQKQGVVVTVITCAPNFPKGKVYSGYRNKLWQEEDMDGIRVIRVWSYISANQGFLKRILDYLSYAFMAFWASLFIRTDLIIGTSPQFFAALCACCSAIIKRKKWVMEVRDLWPESIKAVGAMKNERLFRWLERLELWLYRRARHIVVVTDAFKANLIERGIPSSKISVIKNGVQLQDFSPRPADQEKRQSLGGKDAFILGYLGTHGMAHKLDFILDAALDAPTDVHFVFIGDGAEKQRMLDWQAKHQLSNVHLLPPIPKSAVADHLALFDLALIPLRKSDTFKTVIPSKIFENAAIGLPILLGVEGEAKTLVESYGAGLAFEPENKTDFLQAVKRLQNDKVLYSSCQQGGTKLAKDFDRQKLANEMLMILKQKAL